MSFTSGEGGSSTELDRSSGRIDPSDHTTVGPSLILLLHTISPPTWVSGRCSMCCCWLCAGEEEVGDVGWMDNSANPRSRFRLSDFRTRLDALPFGLKVWFGCEACGMLDTLVVRLPSTAPATPRPPPPSGDKRSSGHFRLRVCENHG